MPDPKVPLEGCRRVLLCTGKVYYDLMAARSKRRIRDVPIIRIEQLYPLSSEELMASLDGLADGTEVCWVQEEPNNMGAWPYVKLNYGDKAIERFRLMAVTRPESASPSTGSMAAHKIEQAELIVEAFANLKKPKV